MPNQPKTPARAVRIDAETWARLHMIAMLEDVTVSDLIREGVALVLARYHVEQA